MVNDPFGKEKIMAFIHGEMDPEEASRFNERLEHDPALRQEVAALSAMDNSLSALFNRQTAEDGDLKLNPAQRERIRAAAASAKKESKGSGWLTGFAIGSLVTAAAAGILFLTLIPQEFKNAPMRAAAPEEDRLAKNEASAPPAAELGAEQKIADRGAAMPDGPTEAPAAPLPSTGAGEIAGTVNEGGRGGGAAAVGGFGAGASNVAAADAPQPPPPTEPAPAVEEKQAEIAVAANEPPPPAAAPPAPEPAQMAEAPSAPLEAPKKMKTSIKAGASAASGRFATLSKACEVYDQPQSGAKSVNHLTAGSRLWTESAEQSGWRKVYRKNGTAYVADDCFTGSMIAANIGTTGRSAKGKGDELALDAAPAAKPEIVAQAAPQAKSRALTAPAKETGAKSGSHLSTAMMDTADSEGEALMAEESSAPEAAMDSLSAESASAPAPYYLTFLDRGASSVAGAKDPAKALSYLAEQLDGNTNCLPTTIPATRFKSTLKLKAEVKPNGTTSSVNLEPDLPDGGKIAACFKAKLNEQPAPLKGAGGTWTIILRTE